MCMDYIALAGVNFFLKRGRKLRRLAGVAAVSSLCSLGVQICISHMGLKNVLTHLVINMAMSWLAFGLKGKKEFLENWVFIYVTILFLGGIMEWEENIGLPASFFWGKALVAVGILSGVSIYFMEKKSFLQQIFPVEILHRNQRVAVMAYWDSGNLLTDPYNGKPVNILSKKVASQIFCSKEDAVRYVPYRSLGRSDGLLEVYSAEGMNILQGKKRVEIKPVVFGVAEEGLLEGKEYDVILHTSVMEGDK